MKKFVSVLLSINILLSLCSVVSFAQEFEPVIDEYNELVREYDYDKEYIDSILISKEQVSAFSAPMVSVEELCSEIDADYSDETTLQTGYSTITFEDRTIWFNEKTGAMDIQTNDDDNIVVLDETPYIENDEIKVPLEQFADALGYDTFEENEAYRLTRPYQTCRLLVSTKKRNIDTQNAERVIRDNINGITILQYGDETDAMLAMEYYQAEGFAVENDEIYSLTDDEDYSELTTSQTVSGIHNSQIASDLIGIDYMNEYLLTQQLEDITVAVLDTGVCSTHPFLKDRIICADVNFSDSKQSNSEDDRGHGTHVTGIIVDNTLDNVTVLNVKALSDRGRASDYQLYCGLKYIETTDAKVLNMSLGKYGKGGIMEDVILDLYNKGVTVVVAAGNDGGDSQYYFPAGLKECVTVGAISAYTKKPASFTNFGNLVDIAAPGVSINSTWLNNSYEVLDGTSMATPFVSAVVGMLCSKTPSLTPFEIENIIKNGANKSANNYYENLWSCGYLYCNNLFYIDRAKAPKANYESGHYTEKISVELTCDEENAKIYYTTGGKNATKENGILYTKPIVCDNKTTIHAVSYVDDKFKSEQAIYEYSVYILPGYGDDFYVNSRGYIYDRNKPMDYYKNVVVPEVIGGRTVKGVASSLFKENPYVETVVLPKTCQYIEANAFEGCTNLVSVEGLGVTNVGANAFYNQSKAKINLGTLSYVGSYAFYNCSSANDLDIADLTTAQQYAFYGVPISDINCKNVEVIEESAFANNKKATLLNLNKLERLGKGAFSGSKIKEANLLNCDTIEANAFSNCPLTDIRLGNITEIPTGAFYQTYLTSFDFQDITKIGSTAFYKCSYLTDIDAPLVEAVGKNAFFTCEKLNSVNLPNVEILEEACFSTCKNLETVKLGEKLTSIGKSIFASCTHLKDLFAPNVVSIDVNGLSGCLALKTLEMPNLVTVASGGVSGCDFDVLNTPNLETIYSELNCSMRTLNLKKLTILYSISNPNLVELNLPNCTEISAGIKANNLTFLYLPNLTKFGLSSGTAYLLKECTNIREVELPNLKTIIGNNSRISSSTSAPNLKRLYVPMLYDNSYNINGLTSIRFYIDTNLPEKSSRKTLYVDVTGVNLEYQWYYSKTNADDFEAIPNATSSEYSPCVDGYYYVKITSKDYKKIDDRVINSKTCYYTKIQPSHNLNISTSSNFSALVTDVNGDVLLDLSTSSININLPEGAKVKLSYKGDDFEAWLDDNNRVVSWSKDYTFELSSKTVLYVNIKRSSNLSSTVSFYKSNGEYISDGNFSKYIKFKSDKYPSAPVLYGHTFVGWDKSVDEINSELSLGHNVIVIAQFELDDGLKSVEVSNGQIKDENDTGLYPQFSYLTIIANEINNKDFWYWYDVEDGIVSYEKEYTFYLTKDVSLVAIYGEKPISSKPIVRITGKDVQESKITFISERYTPQEYDVLETGIILTNNYVDDYSFSLDGGNVLKATSVQRTNCGTYTITKKNVSPTDNWHARAYMVYRDSDGLIHTIYSKTFV